MKIVFLDQASLGDDLDYSKLEKDYKVEIYPTTKSEDILSHSKDADVIITNKVKLTAEALKQLDKLRLIIVTATGVNNIDLKQAADQGVTVKNAIGYASESVAYNTLAMYFHLNQNLNQYSDYTSSLKWNSHHSFSYFEQFQDLSHQTWGIVGLGNIGKQVAKIVSSFGAKVLFFSTSGSNKNTDYRNVGLKELLECSDVISVHCALSEKTNHLFKEKEFSLMKKCHTFLNLSRGEVIDELALKQKVVSSELKVGLDVLSDEPDVQNSPLKDLITNKRVLLTPHMSWASVISRQKLLVHIEQNLKHFLEK